MTKKKKKAISTKKDERVLAVVGLPGETDEQMIARTTMNPALQSAATIQMYANSSVDLDLAAMIECLEKQNEDIGNGSLERIEGMLLAQAHTLDAIANSLFRRAKNQEYMTNLESFLKLGLRAQSQCRTTLEALLRAKTPKTRLNQTNIAHNQQVNNGVMSNELMEKTDGERLDTGTPREAVRVDPELATVDE